MAVTDVSICSNALALLGEKAISSLSDDTDAARACNAVYANLRDAILAQHPWRFLFTKKKLTKDGTDPVNEWSYAHIIPTDAISSKVWAVFSSSTAKTPITNYEVFGDRIYSDHLELWADYKVTKAESAWPKSVVLAMTYAMASEIAFTVTDQQSTADYWFTRAYGLPSENGLGGQLGAALSLEAKTQGTQGLNSDAFIDARHGGV